MNKDKKTNNQKGFSLLELIIYIGIVSVISLVASQAFLSLSRAKSQVAARAEVNNNVRYVLEKFNQDLSAAASMSVPAAAGDSSSSVSMIINGSSTLYFLEDGFLKKQVGANPAEEINSADTIIDNLSFTRLENVNTAFAKKRVTIKMVFDMSFRGSSPDGQFSRTVETAGVLASEQ